MFSSIPRRPPSAPVLLGAFIVCVLLCHAQNLAKVAASIEARKKKEAETVPESVGTLSRDPQQVFNSYPSATEPNSITIGSVCRLLYIYHMIVGCGSLHTSGEHGAESTPGLSESAIRQLQLPCRLYNSFPRYLG